MTKLNNKHISTIARSSLNRYETWTYYHSIYLPSITFSLPTGYLRKGALDHLDSKAKMVFLPKMGYNRYSSLKVIYGPADYGGIELRSLYTEQGVHQMQLFLKHWRHNGPPGKLLRVAVSWAQLVAGTSTSILSNVTHPFLTCSQCSGYPPSDPFSPP